MLRIRLRRVGNKNNAQYRMVVTEHTSPIKGKFIDWVGSYNPYNKAITLKKERLLEWMNKGAKPSNTVAKLMKKNKIDHPSIVVKLNKPRISKAKAKELSKVVVDPGPKTETEPDSAENKIEKEIK